MHKNKSIERFAVFVSIITILCMLSYYSVITGLMAAHYLGADVCQITSFLPFSSIRVRLESAFKCSADTYHIEQDAQGKQ